MVRQGGMLVNKKSTPARGEPTGYFGRESGLSEPFYQVLQSLETLSTAWFISSEFHALPDVSR